MGLPIKIVFGFGGSASLFFILGILSAGAKFFVNSKRSVRFWRPVCKNIDEMKYLRILKRSFRPLRFEMPGYFKITNLTMLKFLLGVSRGTFRTLLTLK